MSDTTTPRAQHPAKCPKCAHPVLIYSDATTLILSVRQHRQGADLAAMLPYLACYMGHADLRGTQYYLRLTADAYPEVMARAQVRFGYVIPAPGDEQ